jgi:hypothetical protein
MMSTLRNILQFVFIGLCFLIPMIWWTRLNANYYSTKLFFLFFTSSFALLIISFNFSWNKIPKPIIYSTLFIIVYQYVFHLYRLDYSDFLYVFKFFSFSVLGFYFYTLRTDLEQIFKKTTYLIMIAAVFILAVSFKEFYAFRIENMSTELGLVSTFGNINMFAEFFVLSLPFMFAWSRYTDRIPKWFKLVLLTCWLFFILYCRSRSAWIGLGLWLVLLLRYKISKKEIFVIGMAFLFYFISIHTPAKENTIASVKDYNTVARWALATSSFEIIKDNPWGIKPGEFMGEIGIYQLASEVRPSEFSYFDQPHSEFIKWPVQFGWLFGLASIILLLSVSWIILNWFLKAQNLFLVGSFAVLIPQIFFQFPYENPASLLYLSLVTALFYLNFPVLKTIKLHMGFRIVTVILAGVGFWNAFAFVNSVYQESTYQHSEKIITACDYYPINHKACHAKLVYFINNKKNLEFVTHFKQDFLKQPIFVDYLRLLPTYYSLIGDNKKTCQSLFFYRTLFPNSETFDKNYYEKCKGFADIFYFQNPLQFKTQYLNWLGDMNSN